MNLENLTKAPWMSVGSRVDGYRYMIGNLSHAPYVENAEANAAFIVLARNDLDVKLRRGWHTQLCGVNTWCCAQAVDEMHRLMLTGRDRAKAEESVYQKGHDVGLLTKAEEWYKANVAAVI